MGILSSIFGGGNKYPAKLPVGTIVGQMPMPVNQSLTTPTGVNKTSSPILNTSAITNKISVGSPAPADKPKVSMDQILDTVSKVADIGVKVGTAVGASKGASGSPSYSVPADFKPVYDPKTGKYDYPEVVIQEPDDLITKAKQALDVLSGNRAIKTDNSLDIGNNMTPILWGAIGLLAVLVISNGRR